MHVSLHLEKDRDPRFHVDVEVNSGACQVRPHGELDLATVPLLEEELARVQGTEAGAIILDLRGLTFMDSTGLRLLLMEAARSRADGDRLRLVRPGGQIEHLLEMAGALESLPWDEPDAG